MAKCNKAVDNAAEGNNSQALSTLLKMDLNNLGHLAIDYYILKSYLLLKNRRAEETKSAIADALAKLKKSQIFNEQEKLYRHKYLESLMARLFGRAAELDVTYEDIHLQDVSERTKSLFPLRHHPHWKE